MLGRVSVPRKRDEAQEDTDRAAQDHRARTVLAVVANAVVIALGVRILAQVLAI
ncbi:MAG TPA: hypothetical protein VIN37_00095 [Candidatus Limnocylindria bacterium]|jgi:hypothetical protein